MWHTGFLRYTAPAGPAPLGLPRPPNVEAEILNVVIDEAREGYQQEVVLELQSDTTDQMDANVERYCVAFRDVTLVSCHRFRHI